MRLHFSGFLFSLASRKYSLTVTLNFTLTNTVNTGIETVILIFFLTFTLRHWQLLANTIGLWKWTSEADIWTLLRLLFLNSIIRWVHQWLFKVKSPFSLYKPLSRWEVHLQKKEIPSGTTEAEKTLLVNITGNKIMKCLTIIFLWSYFVFYTAH